MSFFKPNLGGIFSPSKMEKELHDERKGLESSVNNLRVQFDKLESEIKNKVYNINILMIQSADIKEDITFHEEVKGTNPAKFDSNKANLWRERVNSLIVRVQDALNLIKKQEFLGKEIEAQSSVLQGINKKLADLEAFKAAKMRTAV